MRYVLLVLLLLGGFGEVYARDMRLQVIGDVLIGADGRVADFTIQDQTPTPIVTLLDRSVRGWTFEPTLRDGQAVKVRTRLNLTLAARKRDDGGYLLQVEQIRFTGVRKAITQKPPRYPHEAARAGISGDVLMAVRIDAQGKVVDVAPVQASLPYRRVKPNDIEYWGKAFEGSAAKGIRDWAYEPADAQAGETDTTLIVSVSYRMEGVPPASDGWSAAAAGPAHRIPWLSETEQQFDPSGLKDYESIAIGSQPVIKTPVLGKVL